jgi:hypothetical protein
MSEPLTPEQMAAQSGETALRILDDIRKQTGGWFDCDCGDCFHYGRDFHAWEAFESNAADAIHYAAVFVAERDAMEIARLRQELAGAKARREPATVEEKLASARELIAAATRQSVAERRARNDATLCRCGHQHDQHALTCSINYTAGYCQHPGCRCHWFLMADGQPMVTTFDGLTDRVADPKETT